MSRTPPTAERLTAALDALAGEAAAERRAGPFPASRRGLEEALGLRPHEGELYSRLALLCPPDRWREDALAEGYRAGPIWPADLEPIWQRLRAGSAVEQHQALADLRARLAWGPGAALALAVHQQFGDREALARLAEDLRQQLAAHPAHRTDLPWPARRGLALRFQRAMSPVAPDLAALLAPLGDARESQAAAEPVLRLALAAEQLELVDEVLARGRLRLNAAWQSGEVDRYRRTAAAAETVILGLRARLTLTPSPANEDDLAAVMARLDAFEPRHCAELDRPLAALAKLRAAEGRAEEAEAVRQRIRSEHWRAVAARPPGGSDPAAGSEPPPASWKAALAAPWHGPGVTQRISPVTSWARAAAELPDGPFAAAAGRAWDEVQRLPEGARDGRWAPVIEGVLGRLAIRCDTISLARARRYRAGLAERAETALGEGRRA